SMSRIAPAERCAIGHGIVIDQLLGRGVARPVMVAVRPIVTAYVISTLIFEINKETPQDQVSLAIRRYRLAAPAHGYRHVVLCTSFWSNRCGQVHHITWTIGIHYRFGRRLC